MRRGCKRTRQRCTSAIEESACASRARSYLSPTRRKKLSRWLTQRTPKTTGASCSTFPGNASPASMRIDGEWHLGDDGVARPVIRGEILAADGSWVPASFLLD